MDSTIVLSFIALMQFYYLLSLEYKSDFKTFIVISISIYLL